MILTDTHTHLYSEEFETERDAMMQRAFDVGVQRLFVPSIDSSYTQKMLDLEAHYPHNVFLMMACIRVMLNPKRLKKNWPG